MKHNLTTEEIQERAALYALGALSQQEARVLETHLSERCEICEQELNQFEGVAAQLGFAAVEQSPPDYLRDVLMSRIERESHVASPILRFPDQSARTANDTEAPVIKTGRNYLPWALAASLAIVALASALFWKQANDRAASLKQELAAARAEADEVEQIRSTIASSTRTIQLGGQEVAPDSRGNVYWDTEKNRWVVIVKLPPAPAGKVYQLWYVTPEAKISAGLIKTKPDGEGSIVVNLPPNISSLAAVAITLEPEGGSTQPTMPIYALGKT